MINYKNCIEKGLLRKIPPSRDHAESSIQKAEKWLDESKKSLENGAIDSSVLASYLVFFHAARSILFFDGYREKSHACVARYIEEKYVKNIYTIGYVPKVTDIKVDKNQKRYNEIRKTNGEEFSPLEATQYWLDIISSEINPKQVKLLVINGGKISEAEYKLALTLGAKVGIIEGSGGETSKLFSDTDWNASINLIQLPNDSAIIKSFIDAGISELDKNLREIIAVEIHKQYRETRMKLPDDFEPSLAVWENLQENLKESNRHQASRILEKLNIIGCAVREIKEREIALMKFSKREIELMAELEHARWVVERLSDGWKPAKTKDVLKKLSPYLVGWKYLSEDIKGYDRDTVKKIPEYLAKVGLEVYRKYNIK